MNIQPPDYWLPLAPPFDSQYSQGTATDSNSCVSESLVSIIEMLQENKYRWSPRALAYFSATTIQGNSETNVLDTVNKVGFIPYDLWPTPETFTWAEFYTPVPKEIWQQADKTWKVKIIPPDIQKSPLWTILDFTKTDHAVAQLTVGRPHDLYYDSEPGGAVKTIYQTILSQHSIQLTKESMHLINDNGTFYIVGELGKIGIADVGTLQKLQKVTAEVTTGSSGNVPTVGVFKTQSVLVDH